MARSKIQIWSFVVPWSRIQIYTGTNRNKAGDGRQQQLAQHGVHSYFIIFINSLKIDDTHTILYYHAISLHMTLIELYPIILQQTKIILKSTSQNV